MNLKAILPWVCVLALLVGLGMLYSSNTKMQAELGQLRADSQELQNLRVALEETNRAQAQLEGEVTRLRKDNEGLLRLRNEVGQLRQERQRITQQTQALQAQADAAQNQVEALRQNAARSAQAAMPGQAATPVPQANLEQVRLNACLNNLRQLDGAKQQWALENRKQANAVPTEADITPYLRSNTIPACPAGGTYTLGSLETVPECSIPGHALPK